MKYFLLKCMLFLNLLLLTFVYADVWVLDINDTITIRNDVDSEKTPDVVKFQLVAQNTFLKDEPTVSLEAHIKRTVRSKTDQRATYRCLPEYAEYLKSQGLISEETYSNILPLSAIYQSALDLANSRENKQFFPSLFTFIEFILRVDPSPTIIFQSFGDEIPLALSVMERRYAGILTVETKIGIFDEHHHLAFKDKIYTVPATEVIDPTSCDMRNLLTPFTVMGWKNNYKAGGRKLLFFESESEKYPAGLTTRFFDDNSDRFASVYRNGEPLSIKDGYDFASPYIHKVDTGKALTEPDYFMKLVAHQFT